MINETIKKYDHENHSFGFPHAHNIDETIQNSGSAIDAQKKQ